MVFEVTITYDGCECVLTFDLMPTFEELRTAVKADFVSSETGFQMTGVTSRGSVVHVKDQASLTRVIGARNECSIEVTEQLNVARSASPARRKQTTPAGEPVPSKPRSGIKMQAACDGAIDGLKSEMRVACSTGPTVWMAEKDTAALVVRDVADSAVLHTLKYESFASSSTACNCLLYVKRGGSETVWAGFTSKEIKVFDARTYAGVATLREHSGAVMALTQAPGTVFSGSTDFTILQWNPDTYQLQKLFSGHKNSVRCLGSVKQKLASGGDDGALILWNASTSEPIFHLNQAHAGGIHALAVVNGAVWTAGEDGYTKVWDLATFDLLAHHKEHNGDVTQLLRMERKIISVGTDRRLVMYDAKQHTVIGPITHPHASGPLTLFPVENKQLFRVWCTAGDKTMSLWKVEDQLPDGFLTMGRSGFGLDNDDRSASPSRRSSSAVPMPPVQAVTSADVVQLAIVKTHAEERTDRLFIQNEEARGIAELLLHENRDRARFESSSMAAESYATITLELYSNAWVSSLASHTTAIAMSGTLLGEMAHMSQHNQSVSERLITGYRTEQEGAERTVTQLRGQVTALHEELRELHTQYDTLLAAHDKRKLELETAHNTRTNSEDSLRRYQEENKALQQRNSQLQTTFDELSESSAVERKAAEEKLHKAQQECDERVFSMQQRVHDVEGKLEAAERSERNATSESKGAKEAAESSVRRAELKLASAQEEEKRMAEKLDGDRELWKQQLKAADESYDGMKASLTAKLNEHVAQLEQLQVECRDAQHGRRTVEDKLSLAERRAALAREEMEDESRRLKVQLTEARDGWKTEVELLEKTLSERSNTQQSTDQRGREKDAQLAEVQTNNMALQRRLDALNDEFEKSKAQASLSAGASDQRIASLESFLADAKAELAKQEELLKSERTGRAEAEHQLTAAEENYEAVRRRHSDELQTIHEEATRERMSLLQKNRALEEGTSSTIRELSTQAQSRQTQVDSLEAIHKSLAAEHEQLKELAELHQRKCTSQQQQLEDERKHHADEVGLHRRNAEARNSELEALQQRYHRDVQRDGESLAEKTEECDAALAAQRRLEAEVAQLTSAAERDGRKLEDIGVENSRLKERLQSERAMGDDKFSESSKQADDLRAEMATMQSALQAKTLEAEAMLHSIEELETMLRNTRDEGDRVDVRTAAQLADKEEQVRQYNREKNDGEKTIQELRTFASTQAQEHSDAVAQLQRDLTQLRTENRSLSEDVAAAKQRGDASSHRVAQLLEDKTIEVIAVKAAAEKDVQAAEAKVAQARDDAEIVRSAGAEAQRKLELQDESSRQQQKGLVEKHTAQQLRVDDLQAQLTAKGDEMIALQRRHAEEVAQEQEAAARRLEAARDSSTRGKQELLDEVEGGKRTTQRLTGELQELQESVRDLQEAEKQTARKHAAALTEKTVAVQKLGMENETLAKMERHAKEELDAATTKARQDLERESSLLMQKSAELDAALIEKRRHETQAMTAQMDLEHSKRRIADLEKDVQRLQERADAEYKAREEQLKGHMREQDELRQAALETKQAVLERTAEARELERQLQQAEEGVTRSAKRAEELEEQQRAALAAHEERLGDATAQLKELQGAGRNVRQDLEDEIRTLRSKLETAERDLHATQRDLQTAEGRCASADAKLQEERGLVAHERADLHEQVKQQRARAGDIEQELAATSGELRDAINESDKTFAALEAARTELGRTTSDAAKAREEGDTREGLLRRELDDAKAAATASKVEGVREEQQRTERHIAALQDWLEGFFVHTANTMAAKEDAVLDVAREVSFNVLREVGDGLEELNRSRDEVQRQVAEMASVKRDAERARSVSQSHNDLLGEVRLEMNSLHARLQQEAREHDQTRVELMTLRSRLSSQARDEDVNKQSELTYLQTVITTLEAEKKALQHRADLANADFAAQFPRGRSAASPAPAAPASFAASEATTFILQTRHELTSHIADLVHGIKEANKLTHLLGQKPPLMPDTHTLVCVHDWLDSARTRGDIILRTLLTQEEQQSVVK